MGATEYVWIEDVAVPVDELNEIDSLARQAWNHQVAGDDAMWRAAEAKLQEAHESLRARWGSD